MTDRKNTKGQDANKDSSKSKEVGESNRKYLEDKSKGKNK